MSEIKLGDSITIEGLHRVIANPDRRWWQLWKPRMVETSETAEWTVVGRLEAKP